MEAEEIIQLWYHYEEVAMHFNELIMQYRLQLMAGIGALGALFSYLANANIEDESRFKNVRAYLATVLIVIFIGAAVLDLFYYSVLLEGAVTALINLEEQHPNINLSTTIRDSFTYSYRNVVYAAYGCIFIPLLVFFIYAWCKK